ncbi:MAG: DUF423 domain-containing protein [Putridiphycobacter sp.]
MKKNIVTLAVFFILIAIILGAFGAHGLKDFVSEKLLLSFDKGVKYLMYSGLGLLVLGFNNAKFDFDLKWVYTLIISGTLLFSVNIFIYTFHESVSTLKNFVHLVPVGGMLMIIGWAMLGFKLLFKK